MDIFYKFGGRFKCIYIIIDSIGCGLVDIKYLLIRWWLVDNCCWLLCSVSYSIVMDFNDIVVWFYFIGVDD